MSEDKLSTILAGVSGEYYVAAELSKRGYIASITLRNTKGVDILCSNIETMNAVGIQVKTYSGSKKSWILNQKAENYFENNIFYVFVTLNDNQNHPDFHIVPSAIVAEYCRESHIKWKNAPGKNGQKHNDTPMRKFEDFDNKYLNRWDLLNL